MRGRTGRCVRTANTSTMECKPMNPLSCPVATRSTCWPGLRVCGWLCSQAATRTVVSKKISTGAMLSRAFPSAPRVRLPEYSPSRHLVPRRLDGPTDIDPEHGRLLVSPLEEQLESWKAQKSNSHWSRFELQTGGASLSGPRPGATRIATNLTFQTSRPSPASR